MSDTAVLEVATSAMIIAFKLSAPVLLTALVVGFGISLLQSVTQIQEVTLSFVPKMVGVGVALLVAGNWMLHQLVGFTEELFAQIPRLLGG